MSPPDLVTLGAALLSTRDLVRALVGRARLSDHELDAAVQALELAGPARDAALRAHRAGPALLAALELGRRGWQLSPRGRRVRGPSDVAAIARPFASEERADVVVALDVRMRVARVVVHQQAEVASTLSAVLAAGCTRFVVARVRAGPAVPTPHDVADARALADAARVVRTHMVDTTILGDDGVASLVRLGLLGNPDDARDSYVGDPRYR